MIYTKNHAFERIPSPLGDMLVASSALGLAGMWFDGQKHMPDLSTCTAGSSIYTQQAAQQIDQYFAGQLERFNVPLDLSAGTKFQQSVWLALLEISSGQSSSYGAVAKAICNPQAVRAVGAAVGRNPISIIVPCHRILGSNGALTGYAGGLERKIALLQLEGVLL